MTASLKKNSLINERGDPPPPNCLSRDPDLGDRERMDGHLVFPPYQKHPEGSAQTLALVFTPFSDQAAAGPDAPVTR